MNYKGWGR